jgi:hypothetical protein
MDAPAARWAGSVIAARDRASGCRTMPAPNLKLQTVSGRTAKTGAPAACRRHACFVVSPPPPRDQPMSKSTTSRRLVGADLAAGRAQLSRERHSDTAAIRADWPAGHTDSDLGCWRRASTWAGPVKSSPAFRSTEKASGAGFGARPLKLTLVVPNQCVQCCSFVGRAQDRSA